MACFESFRTTVALDDDYRCANKPDGIQHHLPVIVVVSAMLLLILASSASSARAATVPLGTLSSFAVLGGSTVTNTGPSVISGNLGVSPGTAVTGFPPGTVMAGTVHAADAVALQAQTDLTGCPVSVVVVVSVTDGAVGACCVQAALVILLVSKVTAALRASARPKSVAPVFIEIAVSARMFPANCVDVWIVAELPTCQNTLQD